MSGSGGSGEATMPNVHDSRLLRPFRVGPRVSPALVAAFALVNGLVLANALLHDPRIGYDARGYAAYVEVLSEGRLPTPHETYEYFSPPLPFVLPAAVRATTRALGVEDGDSRWLAWKSGQLGNLPWSLLLTYLLLELGRWLSPGRVHLRLTSLLFVGLLPVYQQAFAGMRGEPLVASLGVAVAWATLRSLHGSGLRGFAGLGVLLGLLALTRQWALAVVAAAGLVGLLSLAHAPRRLALVRLGCLAGVIAVAIAGPFYLHLQLRYGSITPHQQIAQAENIHRPGFSFANQPHTFYFDMRARQLFSDPIFPSLPNRMLPQLHSTLWGDYWGTWVVAARDIRDGSYVNYLKAHRILRKQGDQPWLWTNRAQMSRYLGLVNAVSLLPSALLVASLGFGLVRCGRAGLRREPIRGDLLRLATAVVALSLASYLYYLVVMPDPVSGTTLKAMYQLHAFPFWALLVAEMLEGVRSCSRRVYLGVVGALALVFLFDARVLVTSYREWW